MNRLFKFAIVGCVGFIVDALVFGVLFYLLSFPLIESRVIAFVCAATSTWLGNRMLTFSDRNVELCLTQWARFMVSAMVSAIPNFCVFTVITHWFGTQGMTAMFALSCGVLVGMISNYALSSRWVFKSRA